MRTLSIFFLVLLFYIPSSAQYFTDTLVNKVVSVGPYSTKEVKVTLEKGDRIILDFSEAKERSISAFTFVSPLGKELQMKKEKKIEERIIDIFESGEHIFRLFNAVALKRKCSIQVRKILPTPEKLKPELPPFIPIRDTVYTMDSITKLVKTDTTRNIVLETSVYTNATMDIGKVPKSSIKVELPPGIDYWTFWLGADQDALKVYTEFAGTIPADWAANPVEAYGLGKVSNIPQNSIGERVKYFFADEYNQDLFLKGRAYQAYSIQQGYERSAHGKVYAYSIPSSKALYLCVENQNDVTGITTHFKVSAFKINKEYGTEVKKNMSIQVINAPSTEPPPFIPSNDEEADSIKYIELTTAELAAQDELKAANAAFELAKVARNIAIIKADTTAKERENWELTKAREELSEAHAILNRTKTTSETEVSQVKGKLKNVETAQRELEQSALALEKAQADYNIAKNKWKEAKKTGNTELVSQTQLEKDQAEEALDSIKEKEAKALKAAEEKRLAGAYANTKEDVDKTTFLAQQEIDKAQKKVDEANAKLKEIENKLDLEKQLKARTGGIQQTIESGNKVIQTGKKVIEEGGKVIEAITKPLGGG